MKRVSGVCSIAFGLLLGSHAMAQSTVWPRILPLHESRAFIFDSGEEDTPFLAYIQDARGTKAYKLECHNGNYNSGLDENFSGDLMCVLFAMKGDAPTGVNLLQSAEDEDIVWWNRGRMLAYQLGGDCLAYPEFSTDRNFRLRGMRVTLRFSNIGWSSPLKDIVNHPMRLYPEDYPSLAKFTFSVDIVQDPTARSPIAEAPKGQAEGLIPANCYP